MLQSINDFCNSLEKDVLNPIGKIPLVGSLSAGVRDVYAAAQFTFGAVEAVAFTALGIPLAVVEGLAWTLGLRFAVTVATCTSESFATPKHSKHCSVVTFALTMTSS